MRYLVAIILPPAAVLWCGKPMAALLNVLLTLLLWIPGMIHAILVVNQHYADRRQRQLVQAMRARA